MSAPLKFPKVRSLGDRESILVDPATGEPVLVDIAVFPSGTTPRRHRVAFVLPIEVEDEETKVLIAPPFRIEMN